MSRKRRSSSRSVRSRSIRSSKVRRSSGARSARSRSIAVGPSGPYFSASSIRRWRTSAPRLATGGSAWNPDSCWSTATTAQTRVASGTRPASEKRPGGPSPSRRGRSTSPRERRSAPGAGPSAAGTADARGWRMPAAAPRGTPTPSATSSDGQRTCGGETRSAPGRGTQRAVARHRVRGTLPAALPGSSMTWRALNPWSGLAGLPRDSWLLALATPRQPRRDDGAALPGAPLHPEPRLLGGAGGAGPGGLRRRRRSLTSPFAGRLADRVGPQRILIASLVLGGLGFWALPLLQDPPSESWWGWSVLSGVVGGDAPGHPGPGERPGPARRSADRRSRSTGWRSTSG